MNDARLALIPARGGSKRLPRKNLVAFQGLPLIAHTILAAQAADLFASVAVSTDDEAIAETAAQYGATIVNRPAALASDTASLEEATLHALDTLEMQGECFDLFCLLMPNCPLRLPSDICASLEQMQREQTDYLMSVVEYGWLKPYWALEEAKNGLHPYFKTQVGWTDGQSTPSLVCPSGAIRWVSVSAFRRDRTFYGPGLRGYRLPLERSADIDNADDLALAERFAQRMRGRDSH